MLPNTLDAYWSASEIGVNVIILLNLFGALLLGLTVGYERSFHGRAAGMRTYGLVCMASAAMTVIVGYPEFWYGGHANPHTTAADLSRVIQGIVTGIGFLGAGVIMKEGMNISGLTTAASIWATSAIGVLVGVGFYLAALSLTLLAVACMMWVSRLEHWLPTRSAVGVTLRFRQDFAPKETVLRQLAKQRGYNIASGTLAISFEDGHAEWRFVAIAKDRSPVMPLSDLARELASFDGVDSFQLTRARN
ncbi:MAG: MgtC/SapB family protein [Zoogloeaceae bacterium]|jgi:putative Mg2+ transporter-C (MgtC) family protein|nr:MgtC/SapB family protein [Zoogloeaceae bacterium]